MSPSNKAQHPNLGLLASRLCSSHSTTVVSVRWAGGDLKTRGAFFMKNEGPKDFSDSQKGQMTLALEEVGLIWMRRNKSPKHNDGGGVRLNHDYE